MNPLRNRYGELAIVAAVQAIQKTQRSQRSKNQSQQAPKPSSYVKSVSKWLAENRSEGYRRVFNLTGVLLHSNLGRAQISEAVYARTAAQVTQPMTLEFDIQTGQRGERDTVLKERLEHLIGCESATFVNNNAAALLLVANTFARGKSVIVARSELIEIGGSFRLPEIIEAAGCHLLEVGTTNRTHLADFEAAISHEVGLILKVHPSNFRIAGFTNEVRSKDLAVLAKEHAIPLAVDLGSGSLINLAQFELPNEPQPQDLLRQGVDLVTFSGDKLLNGPQAGIILGSQDSIQQLNANPMKRALRLDKFALALLDQTLRVYESPDSIPKDLPLFKTLATSHRVLQHRAKLVQALLGEKLPTYKITSEASKCNLGSGALPEHDLDSVCVSIATNTSKELELLGKQLRNLSIPVISRVHKGCIKLDMRCAEPLDELLEILGELG